MTIEPSNDKSKIAVLIYAVETLTETVNKNHKADTEWREAYAGRLRKAETDITFLKAVFGVWGGINSVGVFIASILGLRQ